MAEMKETAHGELLRGCKSLDECRQECEDLERLCGKEYADLWRLLYGLTRQESGS